MPVLSKSHIRSFQGFGSGFLLWPKRTKSGDQPMARPKGTASGMPRRGQEAGGWRGRRGRALSGTGAAEIGLYGRAAKGGFQSGFRGGEGRLYDRYGASGSVKFPGTHVVGMEPGRRGRAKEKASNLGIFAPMTRAKSVICRYFTGLKCEPTIGFRHGRPTTY